MRVKFTKTDRLFGAALAAGLLLHLVLIFSFPFSQDESFYITIPFRLLQGDSLFREEWHLSQLSSVFTFLPVWLWISLKGSSDGIMVFLRCVFLCLYTAAAVLTYRSLRKYGKWAVAAVFLFFTQTPYRILSLNYHSVFTICILLITLCLISMAERPLPRTAFAAGLCIGCCCICNPLFIGAYGAYLILCGILAIAAKRRNRIPERPWKPYVCRKTALFSLLGVCIPAGITVCFFFFTGGKVSTLVSNLPLILESSEYGLGIVSFFRKIVETYKAFHYISFYMPFLLPAMYAAMLLDKKRYRHSHRCCYLFLALIFGGMYLVGIIRSVINNHSWTASMFFSLPLLILTTTCYILTERKNKKLFFHMWLPSAVAAGIHYAASNTMLTTLGFLLAIGNIAGVVFAGDLYREMVQVPCHAPKRKKLGKQLVCGGLCLQMLFHLMVCCFGQIPAGNITKAAGGPCAGTYLSESQNENYKNTLEDLDYIKSLCREDTPILILSYSSWMYLYAEQPISPYTTWFDGTLQTQTMIAYYRENPHKIPKYVYVDSPLYIEESYNPELVAELFTTTATELSQGTLLTVESCNFS